MRVRGASTASPRGTESATGATRSWWSNVGLPPSGRGRTDVRCQGRGGRVERRVSPVTTGQDRRSMSGAGGARRTSVFPRQDGAGPTFDAVAGDSLLVASATASTAQPRASRPPLTSSLGDAVLGAANAGAARSRPPRAQHLAAPLLEAVGDRVGEAQRAPLPLGSIP